MPLLQCAVEVGIRKQIVNRCAGWMLFASASLIILAGGRGAVSQSRKPGESSDKVALEAHTVASRVNYKQWTRATKKPVLVYSRFAMLCVGSTTAQTAQEKTNPHNDKYIVVYVNDIGKHALLREEKPTYPVGTIIVKEKRAKPDSPTPELCTVMQKREAGYSPQDGNWEYFVTDGTGTRLQDKANAINCKSCHAEQKSVDYVFRRYLPDIAYRYLQHQAQKSKPPKS